MLDYRMRTHLEVLKSALLDEFKVTSDADWICRNTKIRGKDFNFKGHEYQRVILDDKSVIIHIKKSSQIGISEISARRVIAKLQRYPGSTAIYVLPTATFSQTFSKTRFATVLDESPELQDSLKPGNDSSALKIFRNGSQVYFKGAASGTAPISIPADFLVFDEKSFFENEEIMTQYQSRLTHSEHKNIFNLSTPILPGRGISVDYEKSTQFVELTKCNHCGHWFDPDYFENVKLPGFNAKLGYKPKKQNSLRVFNYQNREIVADHDLSLAYLACPKCDKAVDTAVEHREWVCKNPNSNMDPHGYHIKPFSCPTFITPGNLILASTTYKSYSDFVNFGLGEDYDTSENSLTKEELEKLFLPPEARTPTYSIMGLDLGGECHVFIAVPSPDRASFRIIHAEAIPLHRLEERYFELCAEFRVICTVSDSMPYTTEIIRLQKRDKNLWGATFTTSKNVELYKIAEKEEDVAKATFGMRQINISRDKTLDFVVDMIREGRITFNDMPLKPTIITHLQDLKRQQKIDKYDEVIYVWSKSARGSDHFFFTLMYTMMALFLMGTSSGTSALPFLISKFRVKDKINLDGQVANG